MAKYFVPDLGLNSTADSPLSLILERLDTDKRLSDSDKKYLRDKGLFDLHRFVNEFEQKGRPNFSILRNPFERDRNRQMQRNLRDRYDIGYVERGEMRDLLAILRRIERGERFAVSDVVWLEEHDCFSHKLRCEFHRREAAHCSQCFDGTSDPWHAVNGSSHYRKAELPQQALDLIARVDLPAIRDNHLRSALWTTMGGAKRDLRAFREALSYAQDAHIFEPKSCHPCTLLGALHYELGDYAQGDEWFRKAIERGADNAGVDAELRAIFRRADETGKEDLRRHLLTRDPSRYVWVKARPRSHKGGVARAR